VSYISLLVPVSLNLPPVAGRFLTPISHAEDLSNKLTEVRSTIKFQLIKVMKSIKRILRLQREREKEQRREHKK
jgi:hypothetical protein